MSITSLSFTFVNTYAPQAAKSTAPAERQAPAQTEAKHRDEQRPATRQNRLVEAMMSALRELGFGSTPPAAPATAPAATDAPSAATTAQAAPAEAVTTNDQAAATAAVADTAEPADKPAATTEAQATTAGPAASVESAVHQFAHELFRALRTVGGGESSEQGSNRIDGDGGHRQHHGGHHGWRREGYGDMAQRLDALSQTFAAPAAVAASSGAQPNALVSTSVSITLTVQDGQPDSSVNASTTAATPDAAAPAVEAGQAAGATAAAVAPEPAKNPLLEAFSKLFGALQPQSAGTPQADMADKLRTFLQTLAQSMRPESMSSIQTPQVGGLVNVTA